MIRIDMYKTYDGEIHENEKKAKKYLDKKYGDILLKMSHNLLAIEKYLLMAQYLDENLSLFKDLMIIKEDMNLIDDEQECVYY